MGRGDVAGEITNRPIPAASVGKASQCRRGRPRPCYLAKIPTYSTPFAGIASPNSPITICKSFQVSFFCRGSRKRNAG